MANRRSAVNLIETTSMPIDAIAEKIGCQDGTTLRKLVTREFDTTPGALRWVPPAPDGIR